MRTISRRRALLTFVMVCGLALWSLATGEPWFIAGLVVIGALAYGLSAVVALVCAAVLTAVRAVWGFGGIASVTPALVELTGYLLVAHLGFRHRLEAVALSGRRGSVLPTLPADHRDRVLPWHVANEVRTSLAAVRFLLFPVQSGPGDSAVKQAVNELERLEGLFEEMEKPQR
ncbi:MAG: hypothetical protein K6T78_14870 [Alicyclobacillus sp.]|nr:hypothetical protein [Alicyclobacillus sp.]